MAFAVALAVSFRPRPAPSAPSSIGTTDPKAVVESSVGSTQRFNLNKEEVRVDYCRMSLPHRPEIEQPAGLVHGGAIASLLDAVMVPAVGAAYGREARFSTVDMHVQFIGAVKQQDIVAEGWVVRRGRSVVFCESEVLNAVTGRLVAKSVLTYNVSGTGSSG